MISFQEGQSFIVTGASSGIGKAIAHKIIENGGSVIAIGRCEKKLKKVFDKKSHVVLVPYDLTENVNALPTFIRDLNKMHGAITGLVHSAGTIELLPLQAISTTKAQKTFDINYWVGLMLAKGVCDKRVNKGSLRSIVYISSIVSLMGAKGQSVYASSKGAVNSLIRPLAMELAASKIRVNAISPGHINTEMTKTVEHMYSQSYFEELTNMYPLGPGNADDVANLCVFLLSDLSRWITGQNIVIDGGRMLW